MPYKRKKNDTINDTCVVNMKTDSDSVGKNQHKPDKKETSLDKPNDKDEAIWDRMYVASSLFPAVRLIKSLFLDQGGHMVEWLEALIFNQGSNLTRTTGEKVKFS